MPIDKRDRKDSSCSLLFSNHNKIKRKQKKKKSIWLEEFLRQDGLDDDVKVDLKTVEPRNEMAKKRIRELDK